jgi:hypothetical protein
MLLDDDVMFAPVLCVPLDMVPVIEPVLFEPVLIEPVVEPVPPVPPAPSSEPLRQPAMAIAVPKMIQEARVCMVTPREGGIRYTNGGAPEPGKARPA